MRPSGGWASTAPAGSEGGLTDYYAFLGDFAQQIAATALTSEEAVRQALAEFDDAGCQELILFPCDADVGQVTLLADALPR